MQELKISLLFVMFLTASLSCKSQEGVGGMRPQIIEPRIDSIFGDYNSLEVPGVAIGVVQNGSLIFKKGYGSANLEYDIPIDPLSTVFTLASVSKQLTVLAILLLEAEQKLSLDDDVRDHFPEIHDYGSIVTLRHLASNTSGLRSDLRLLGMSGVMPDDHISSDMIQDIIFQQKELNFKPGTEFRYSNSGFFLLSEVVSRVSGLPFRTFMKERIFDPLGMTHTFVMDDCQQLVENRADSYQYYNGSYERVIMNYSFAGSTGVWTTLDDFSKWASNFEDPIVGNHDIFKKMNTPGMLNNGTS